MAEMTAERMPDKPEPGVLAQLMNCVADTDGDFCKKCAYTNYCGTEAMYKDAAEHLSRMKPCQGEQENRDTPVNFEDEIPKFIARPWGLLHLLEKLFDKGVCDYPENQHLIAATESLWEAIREELNKERKRDE